MNKPNKLVLGCYVNISNTAYCKINRKSKLYAKALERYQSILNFFIFPGLMYNRYDSIVEVYYNSYRNDAEIYNFKSFVSYQNNYQHYND